MIRTIQPDIEFMLPPYAEEMIQRMTLIETAFSLGFDHARAGNIYTPELYYMPGSTTYTAYTKGYSEALHLVWDCPSIKQKILEGNHEQP